MTKQVLIDEDKLKMVWAALKRYQGFIDDAHIIEGQWHWLNGTKEAIKALEEALAKQEQGEPVGKMTASRAEMFMTRFKHEEKMLGPNEQASLDYVISMLVREQAQGESVATITITQEGSTRTIDNHFADCVRDWPNGEYKLYTTPQQRKPLMDEQDTVSKARYNRVRDDYNELLEKSRLDAIAANRWREHVTHCQLQGVDLDHNFAPQQRKPLTHGQRRAIILNADTVGQAIAMVEAAHGIKE